MIWDDLMLERQRKLKAVIIARYEVCGFMPFKKKYTNSRIFALLTALVFDFFCAESRIIDRKTGKHTIL